MSAWIRFNCIAWLPAGHGSGMSVRWAPEIGSAVRVCSRGTRMVIHEPCRDEADPKKQYNSLFLQHGNDDKDDLNFVFNRLHVRACRHAC
jgi:hypothetical protein